MHSSSTTTTTTTAPSGKLLLEALQRSHRSFHALHIMAETLLTRCVGFSVNYHLQQQQFINSNSSTTTITTASSSPIISYNTVLSLDILGLPVTTGEVAFSSAAFRAHPDFEDILRYCVEHHVAARRAGLPNNNNNNNSESEAEAEVEDSVAVIMEIFRFLETGSREAMGLPQAASSPPSSPPPVERINNSKRNNDEDEEAEEAEESGDDDEQTDDAKSAATGSNASANTTTNTTTNNSWWSDRTVSMTRVRVFRAITLLLVRGLFFRSELNGDEHPLAAAVEADFQLQQRGQNDDDESNGNDEFNNEDDNSQQQHHQPLQTTTSIFALMFPREIRRLLRARRLTPTTAPEACLPFPEAEAHFLRTTEDGPLHDAMNNYAADDAVSALQLLVYDINAVLMSHSADNVNNNAQQGGQQQPFFLATTLFSGLQALHAYIDVVVSSRKNSDAVLSLMMMAAAAQQSDGSDEEDNDDEEQEQETDTAQQQKQHHHKLIVEKSSDNLPHLHVLRTLLTHPACAQREGIASVRLARNQQQNQQQQQHVIPALVTTPHTALGLHVTWRGVSSAGRKLNMSLRVLIQRCIDHFVAWRNSNSNNNHQLIHQHTTTIPTKLPEPTRTTALIELCGFPVQRPTLRQTMKVSSTHNHSGPERLAPRRTVRQQAAATTATSSTASFRLAQEVNLLMNETQHAELRTAAEQFLLGFSKLSRSVLRGGEPPAVAAATTRAASFNSRRQQLTASTAAAPMFDSSDQVGRVVVVRNSDDDDSDSDLFSSSDDDDGLLLNDDGDTPSDVYTQLLRRCCAVETLKVFEVLNPRTVAIADPRAEMLLRNKRNRFCLGSAGTTAEIQALLTIINNSYTNNHEETESPTATTTTPFFSVSLADDILLRLLRAVPVDVAASIVVFFQHQMLQQLPTTATATPITNPETPSERNQAEFLFDSNAMQAFALLVPWALLVKTLLTVSTTAEDATLAAQEEVTRNNNNINNSARHHNNRRTNNNHNNNNKMPSSPTAAGVSADKDLSTLLLLNDDIEDNNELDQEEGEPATSSTPSHHRAAALPFLSPRLRAQTLGLADTILSLLPQWARLALALLERLTAARLKKQATLEELASLGCIEANLVAKSASECPTSQHVLAPLLTTLCLLTCELPSQGGGLAQCAATERQLLCLAQQCEVIDDAWIRVNGRSVALLRNIVLSPDSAWPLFCQKSGEVRAMLGTRVALAALCLLGDGGVDPLLRLRVLVHHTNAVLRSTLSAE